MRRAFIKKIYVFAGLVSLALGVVGIFLPLLPTIPFILLSAFCFDRGSDKLHRWLISHDKFRESVEDWQKQRVIRLRAKIMATVLILLTLGLMFWFTQFSWPIKCLQLGVCASVLLFIWMQKSETSHLSQSQRLSSEQKDNRSI